MGSPAISVFTSVQESPRRSWSRHGSAHMVLNPASSTSGQASSNITVNSVTAALFVLISTTLLPSMLLAEVMIFGRDGSVRTTDGWTFHGRVDEEAPPGDARSFAAAPQSDILEAIRQTATRHEGNEAVRAMGLGPDDWMALFCALIEAESAYRPTARSAKGAYGLGQLMPATARDLGVDRADIAQNLDGSARYLLAQLAAFEDIDLALAAYNAGPHRVEEYGGVPPFPETRDYIARVHRIRARLSNTPLQNMPGTTARDQRRPAVVLGLK